MEMLKGNPDVCAVLKKDEEHRMKLQMFGFPAECPVPAGRKCVDPEKKLDISRFKAILPMAQGKISAHYDITHDTVRILFIFLKKIFDFNEINFPFHFRVNHV